MIIAIVGAGNVGGTLGRRWAELGHDVRFGVRTPAEGEAAVGGGDALPARATVLSIADATRGANVVVLATPWAAVPEALEAMGAPAGALRGVTLIDATNPLGPGFVVQQGAQGESGAEHIAARATGALVVKAFNTTGFGNMANPIYGGDATVMLVAGDEPKAKQTTLALACELGFDSYDVGGLMRARHLEHFAATWIALAAGGLGRDIAFRLVKR